jgi:hypothetical protein
VYCSRKAVLAAWGSQVCSGERGGGTEGPHAEQQLLSHSQGPNDMRRVKELTSRQASSTPLAQICEGATPVLRPSNLAAAEQDKARRLLIRQLLELPLCAAGAAASCAAQQAHDPAPLCSAPAA